MEQPGKDIQPQEVDLPKQDSVSSLNRSIFFGSLGFGILSFALPVYARSLGASALEIGAAVSVFGLAITVGRPLAGMGMDRFGRKSFLVVALLCYATAMSLFGIAHTIDGLYAARLVQGLGSSLLWIAAYTVATELNPKGDRGRAVGQIDGAAARGGLYGAFVGFIFLGLLPLATGWKLIFVGYTIAAVYAAWNAWRHVPETRVDRFHSRVGNRHIVWPTLARLMFVTLLTSLTLAMLSPIIMIYLQDRFTTDVFILAIAFIPAALISGYLPPHLGHLSDRAGRAPLMALGLGISGIVSVLIPRLPNLWWLVLLWAVDSIGFAMAAPAEEAMVADLTGQNVRGTGYGLYTLASGLGITIGPLVGGWLYDHIDPAAPFLVNGIVLLLGAGLVIMLLRIPSPAHSSPNRSTHP